MATNAALTSKFFSRWAKKAGGLTNTCRSAICSTAPNRQFSIAEVTASVDREKLQLLWSDGQRSEFSACWLKENCPSPTITDPVSHGRLLLLADLNIDIKIDKVEQSDSGVRVLWEREGESEFPTEWLHVRRLKTTQGKNLTRELWRGPENPKVHSFRQVIEDDQALLFWLQDLSRHGLTVLEGTPCTDASSKELAQRVGMPKSTHFGPYWNVIAKSEPMNLAYTSATLGLHLDLPFYEYTPGVQVLQCIKQYSGVGGANQFADAFAVAERMRKEFPEEFDLLSTVKVHFWDAGQLDDDSLAGGVSSSARQFHKRHSCPTFILGSQGELLQVAFNNQVRSSELSGDAVETKNLLRALKLFNSLCYSPEHMVKYKLREGDTVVFDNLRVMHGREGFVVEEGQDGARHLFGFYFDWDEIRDRTNVLVNAPLI